MSEKSHHEEHDEHHHKKNKPVGTSDAAGIGGPSVSGSPGVSEGGPVSYQDLEAEEREAADKAFGDPTGERGDLGDSGPGED